MEDRRVVAEGGGNGMGREFGVGRCKLLNLKGIITEVLLYGTDNYIHSLFFFFFFFPLFRSLKDFGLA